MFFKERIECLSIHASRFSCSTNIIVVSFEQARNVARLESSLRLFEGKSRRIGNIFVNLGYKIPEFIGNVLQSDRIGSRHCTTIFDDILKFANVAGPAVGFEDS